jgi:hypothetical protein
VDRKWVPVFGLQEFPHSINHSLSLIPKTAGYKRVGVRSAESFLESVFSAAARDSPCRAGGRAHSRSCSCSNGSANPHNRRSKSRSSVIGQAGTPVPHLKARASSTAFRIFALLHYSTAPLLLPTTAARDRSPPGPDEYCQQREPLPAESLEGVGPLGAAECARKTLLHAEARNYRSSSVSIVCSVFHYSSTPSLQCSFTSSYASPVGLNSKTSLHRCCC